MIRDVQRVLTSNLLAPSYDGANNADADEAEERYAEVRAARIETARKRDERLYEIAEAGHAREATMVRLAKVSTGLAALGVVAAVVAIVVAASAH